MSRTAVYSLADVRVVLCHPDVGQCVLSSQGAGKITISWAGDLSSHTATADGYVVVNRLRTSHGMVTIEITQNSSADEFLRRWVRYLKNAPSAVFAASTLNLVDAAGGFTVSCRGVTPRKIPDRAYDQTSGNLTWTFLAESISEG